VSKYLKLLASVVLCEGAGIFGSLLTFSSITSWYINLNKPFFNPPNSIFGPVWTILYLLMGISLYLVWVSPKSKFKKIGIKLFLAQLGLNVLWSLVFFGGKSPIGGLVVILPLAFLIYKTIKSFGNISKTSAILLYPYLAWVSFATILNLSIVILNP